MRKWILICIVILALLVGLLAYLSATNSQENSQKNDFGYTHSYTKAICDANNFCGDYEIVCDSNKFVTVRFTGYAAQFSQEWEDPRTIETRNKVC